MSGENRNEIEALRREIATLRARVAELEAPAAISESRFRIKAALAQTEARERDLSALLRAARAVITHDDFEHTARKVFDIGREITGAVSGYVALLSATGDENEVLFLEAGGMPCTVDENLPMPIRGLRAEAYRTRDVAYDNAFADSQWMRFMPQGHVDLRNVMFAPLVYDDQVHGLIGLANKPADFTDHDARMVGALGELCAIALRRARDRELVEASEERLRAILDAVDTGIVAVTPEDATVIYANPAAANLLKTTPGELLGAPCDSFMSGAAHCCPVVDRDQHHLSAERELLASDGARIPVWRTITRTNLGGRDCLLESFIDLTPLKEAEQQQRELEERLSRAEKLEAIGQLAGGIAHDFNNQLAGIVGYAELMEQRTRDPKNAKAIRHILRCAERAAELTSHMLAFSRREELCRKPVDLHAVVKDVVTMLKHTIDRRITLDTTLRAARPTVSGDAGKLHNAILNLALNARDAMPDGGTIAIRSADTRLDAHQCQEIPEDLTPGDYLELTVSDTGCGMPEEVLARAFEPFFTTKARGKGTGMGLAAVYGTLRQHNGLATIDSTPGKGTTVSLRLPVILETVTPEAHGDSLVEAPRAATILVVDDEEDVRCATADLLEGLGYRTATQPDGAEAVAWYRAHWDAVDAVILDLIMPRMGGVDALKAMLAINPAARVIVVTGFAEGQHRAALDAGAIACLRKPISLALLSRHIAAAVTTDQPI